MINPTNNFLSNVSADEVEAEAYTYSNTHYNIPNYSLFRNYPRIDRLMRRVVERSYERPNKWYFITFKPFNKTYLKNPNFYKHKTNGFDHCRNYITRHTALNPVTIMTREIEATKIHINMLLCSPVDPSKTLPKKMYTTKYKIFCQQCDDRHSVLQYIIKESKNRYFNRYIDYYVHMR